MARLHIGILVLCLFALTCTAYADIGTVRLTEDRLLFASPATATEKPNQFVKVICHADEKSVTNRPPRTVTTDPIQPLTRASAGETVTILDVIRCGDIKNGAYALVRTAQHMAGYTHLPNYHTRIQTTDPEAAYKILFLSVPPCMLTQPDDPECRASGYGDLFANYARLYPTSPRAAKAAENAAVQYKYAADTFRYIGENGAHPTLTDYTVRYSRNALLAKANEYRTLETQMQTLANQQPAPQQTASTQPTTLNDKRTQNVKLPEPSKPTTQSAATAPQPAPPVAQGNYFIKIFYGLLILLTIAYVTGYAIRYTRILGHIPSREIISINAEGIIFCLLAVGISFFLADYLKPFLLIAFALVLYMRLEARLQPVRDQGAAAELKAKQDTFTALVSLLDHLHGVYGMYAEIPEFVPAAWYEPRRHYIEYMAKLLYTIYAEEDAQNLRYYGITPDSHPLHILSRLSCSHSRFAKDQRFSEDTHPYHFLMCAITEPTNPDHIVFRKLIPANVDLLSYLKSESWKPALNAEAEEYSRLVEQEIIKQKCVIIGRRTNPNPRPFPLFYRDMRFRHSYLIGKTGSGKSTLLRNLIAQDIVYGHGVIVLSPENDLLEKLLTFIPPERKDDLIYFDPTDIKPPIIGFNPLALEDGEDLHQKAGETMTVLTRALGDLGVTMEPLIQNAVYALLQCRNATFADLRRLIDPYDPRLRSQIKNDPNIDETTQLFWTRYEQSSYYQKSHEAVLNRLNPFFRPPISTILATPSLSFKTELNSNNRIIFLNLSRLRGVEASTVGQLLLAQIQQALLVRDELPEDMRIPYYLYIDEFQTYAAQSEQSLINLFNGARKYKLAVTIAHQTTADIPAKLLSSIVGNVGTVMTLQLAAEDAPFFARQLQIRRPNSAAAAPEALQNLSIGYGYATTPLEPFGVHIAIPSTPIVQLPQPIPSDELKSASKKNFGLMPEVEPEPIIETRFTRPPEPEIELEEAPVSTVSDNQETETLTAVEAPAVPQAKPKARARAPRKPVTRKTIKKRSLIPDETIEIE